MGKADRNRNGRSTSRATTSSSPLRTWGPIGAVLAVVVVMVVVFVTREPAAPGGAGGSDSSVEKLLAIPASLFDDIGVPTDARTPGRLPAGTPAVTQGGLPVVTYIGAEYCPYCAAERWAVVAALARFGSFSGLTTTVSGAAPEAYPETPTVTFHGSTYESDYLVLWAAETATNTGAALESLTAEEENLIQTYGSGSIPFVVIGNRYIWEGSSYDVGLLTGLTFDEIATKVSSDPTSPLARAVIGAANVIAAAICDLTGGQPGDVCSSSGVQAGTAFLSSS